MPDERESDDLFEDLDKFFAPIKDVEWDEPEQPARVEDADDEHVSVRPEPEPVVAVPAAEDDEVTSVPDGDELEGDDEDESTWYDTAALEPVDEALGEAVAEDEAFEEPLARVATDEGAAEPEASWPEDVDTARPSDAELEEAAAHFAESIPQDEGSAPRVVQIDEDTAGDLLDELSGAEPYPADEEEEEDVFAAMADEEPARAVVVGAGEGLGGPSWQEPAAGGGGGRPRPPPARAGGWSRPGWRSAPTSTAAARNATSPPRS